MGAADMVPFIPIEGVIIGDCVEMARYIGVLKGHIPVQQ